MSTSVLRANVGYEYSADFQEADMSHTADGLASTFTEPLEKKYFPVINFLILQLLLVLHQIPR